MAVSSPAPADAQPPADVVPRWGLGDFALAWGLGNLGNATLGTAIVVACGYTVNDLSNNTLPLWVLALSYPTLWLGFVLVPIWAARTKGNGLVRDFGLRIERVDLPVGAVVGVLAQLVMVPLVSWPVLKLTDTDASKMEEVARNLTDRAGSPGSVLLLFLTVAVGAPLAEEVLFRGLLLRSIEKRWSLGIAVVASSVVFGAGHLEPLQFVPLTCAGLIFGLLAARTGRLGPAIVAHMAFNATTVALLVWWG